MRTMSPATGRSGVMDDIGAPPSTFFVKIPVAEDAVTADIAMVRICLEQATRVAAVAGRPVRFVNGMYLPMEGCLLCAFTAGREEAVHAAVRLIERPYTLIETRAGGTGPLPARRP